LFDGVFLGFLGKADRNGGAKNKVHIDAPHFSFFNGNCNSLFR
jgi:hypothetical protein